jgi:hypothetical protein
MEHGLISGLNLDLAANPFHQQHEDMKHTTRCILASIMCMVFGFSYTLGKWPAKQNMTFGLHDGLKKPMTFLKIDFSQILNCSLQIRKRDFKKNARIYEAEQPQAARPYEMNRVTDRLHNPVAVGQYSYRYVSGCKLGPCHGIVRPQVTRGQNELQIWKSDCEYGKGTNEDSRHRVVFQTGIDKPSLICSVTDGLEPGQNLCKTISSGCLVT